MTKLNIPLCIDGRMLAAGATGVGSYADTLLVAARTAGLDPLVLAEEQGTPPGRAGRWLRAVGRAARQARREDARLTVRPGLFREAQVHLDMHGRALEIEVEGPPGIMHWTYPVPLVLRDWRNVYTVHDLIPLTRPDLTPISARRHRSLLDAILPNAHRLLAVSEEGRREIVDLLGWSPEQVGNAGEAVDPRPDADSARLPGSYYLAVGTIEPRKNLARLADAYERSGSGRPLLLAGPVGDVALARMLAARRGVECLPYQPAGRLAALIRDARALLMPSLAEGFGLPVAEAMMLGTPVMTSAEGALAETAGGAALPVDPTDVDAMAAAIRRLDTDDALLADLSRRGAERACAFTLDGYARRLVAFYAEAAA